MKLRNFLINSLLLFCTGYLILMFLGINITGPFYYNQASNQKIIRQIQVQYPQLKDFDRHSYRYVTYSSINENESYFFDASGKWIVTKPYSEEIVMNVLEIAEDYGFEKENMQLGYGYDNPVFVFEDGNRMLLLDYDTYEEIAYVRSFEYE